MTEVDFFQNHFFRASESDYRNTKEARRFHASKAKKKV